MEVEKPTRILVLFSGTGSAETQFQRQFKGCEVVTVDILPKWDPLHAADILKWDYRQYPWHYFDVIWASPPCTEYNKAKTVGASDIKIADRRVQRTREIVDFYDPAYYFIENPAGDATGGLHTRPVMKGPPITALDHVLPLRSPVHEAHAHLDECADKCAFAAVHWNHALPHQGYAKEAREYFSKRE
eukprot:gene532-biopygen418